MKAPGLAVPRAHALLLALTITVVVALAFRTAGLSSYGFSEDEINKVQAIQQYRAGNFIVNAEHPMLMKLAMWGSVAAADAWNRHAPLDKGISLETAIRLPNAVAGAATTLVLFGIELLFSTPAASSPRPSGRSTSTRSRSTASARRTRSSAVLPHRRWCYERRRVPASGGAQR